MDRFIALIPARGGSKSIPYKNIKEINGRPLIYWTIDAAINSNYIDKVYISTDDEKIKNIVDEYKVENKNHSNIEKLMWITRSEETATDTASTESVMLEFTEKVQYEHVVLIQATNPLLTAKDLDEGIQHYNKNNYDSLLSVVRQKRFIWVEKEDYVLAKNYNPMKRPRRQEYDGFIVENGAFYITNRESFLQSKCRISGKTGYYEMAEETYFEIDEPSDWIIVEKLLKRQHNNAKKTMNIKLFALDCDGVLTDGGMYFSSEGEHLKKFNTKDGMGIQLLKEKGIVVCIITGENTPIVEARAKKLKIDEVYLGIKDKLKVVQQLMDKYSLDYSNIAYIGDDINDIEVLKKVGLSISVDDGMDCVKEVCDYITKAKGGHGAVREAAEYIIKSIEG